MRFHFEKSFWNVSRNSSRDRDIDRRDQVHKTLPGSGSLKNSKLPELRNFSPIRQRGKDRGLLHSCVKGPIVDEGRTIRSSPTRSFNYLVRACFWKLFRIIFTRWKKCMLRIFLTGKKSFSQLCWKQKLLWS